MERIFRGRLKTVSPPGSDPPVGADPPKLFKMNKRSDLPLMGNRCSPLLTTASYPLSLRRQSMSGQKTPGRFSSQRSEVALIHFQMIVGLEETWKSPAFSFKFPSSLDSSLCDQLATWCVFRPASLSPPPPGV